MVRHNGKREYQIPGRRSGLANELRDLIAQLGDEPVSPVLCARSNVKSFAWRMNSN
jgi:hypothetical protein